MPPKKVTSDTLVIEIDMDVFMIDDLEMLDKVARGEASLSDEIAIFEKVVVGGVRGKFKAHEVRKIRDAVLDALRNSAKDPN